MKKKSRNLRLAWEEDSPIISKEYDAKRRSKQTEIDSMERAKKSTHYKNQMSYGNEDGSLHQSQEVLISDNNDMVMNDVAYERESNFDDLNQRMQFASGQQTMDHSKIHEQVQKTGTNVRRDQLVNKKVSVLKDEGIVKNSMKQSEYDKKGAVRNPIESKFSLINKKKVYLFISNKLSVWQWK